MRVGRIYLSSSAEKLNITQAITKKTESRNLLLPALGSSVPDLAPVVFWKSLSPFVFILSPFCLYPAGSPLPALDLLRKDGLTWSQSGAHTTQGKPLSAEIWSIFIRPVFIWRWANVPHTLMWGWTEMKGMKGIETCHSPTPPPPYTPLIVKS